SPAPQDIPGAMGTATFTWTYQAAEAGFATAIVDAGAGADGNDGAPVPVPGVSWPNIVVQAPAQLSVAASAIPAQVSVGQTFRVTIVATNTGEATALKVLPSIIQQPGTAQVQTTGAAPVAADIAGSAIASFTWTMKAVAAGSVSIAFGAAGSDANSTAVVQAPPSAASPTLVQTPAQFAAATLAVS